MECSNDMQKYFTLRILRLELYVGVGQESVNRSAELSSKIVVGLQKNQLGALIIGWQGYECRRFIEIGAFLATIWHFVILVSENFQHILWEEL